MHRGVEYGFLHIDTEGARQCPFHTQPMPSCVQLAGYWLCCLCCLCLLLPVCGQWFGHADGHRESNETTDIARAAVFSHRRLAHAQINPLPTTVHCGHTTVASDCANETQQASPLHAGPRARAQARATRATLPMTTSSWHVNP